MKTISASILTTLTLFAPLQLQGQEQSEYLSLRLEMERAIRKGNAFLKTQQEKEGFCSSRGLSHSADPQNLNLG